MSLRMLSAILSDPRLVIRRWVDWRFSSTEPKLGHKSQRVFLCLFGRRNARVLRHAVVQRLHPAWSVRRSTALVHPLNFSLGTTLCVSLCLSRHRTCYFKGQRSRLLWCNTTSDEREQLYWKRSRIGETILQISENSVLSPGQNKSSIKNTDMMVISD